MDELKNISLRYLVEELKRRDGVAEIQVDEYTPFAIAVGGVSKNFEKTFGHDVDSGPARIFVVIE